MEGDIVRFYPTKVNILKSLEVEGNTTINGIIDAESPYDTKILNPNGTGHKVVYLGKSITKGNCSALCWWHSGDDHADNNFTIHIQGYGDLYNFYRDRVQFNKPLTVNGNITASNLNNSSDRRLKENIEELNEETSNNLIDNIKVYSFYFKDIHIKKNDEIKQQNAATNQRFDEEEEEEQIDLAPFPKRLHYGVIAQELQELAPELVSTNDATDEKYLTVNYVELIPHLINKIHSQDKVIKELQTKFEQSTTIITQLSEKLDKLYALLELKEATE